MIAASTERFSTLHQICPIEAVLTVMGNKWKGIILYHLSHGTKRHGELKRLLPRVTQRMLTLQLRELEKDNIIMRTVHDDVQLKVEYSLSPLGMTIKPLLIEMEKWGRSLLDVNQSIK